jgi:hypothetical protein
MSTTIETSAPAQTTTPGARCVSVVTVPSGTSRYAITVTKVYVATPRADGVLTWRAVPGSERSRTSHNSHKGISSAQYARAEARAEAMGAAYLPRVRHGSRCG